MPAASPAARGLLKAAGVEGPAPIRLEAAGVEPAAIPHLAEAHHVPRPVRRFTLRVEAVVIQQWAGGLDIRREVVAHHMPWPARRFTRQPVEAQPVLREAADTLR